LKLLLKGFPQVFMKVFENSKEQGAEAGNWRLAGPQNGFTLLEVMIAVAIVGIALVALLGLGNRSIEVNGRLQKITQATLLAQHRMTEIETVPLSAGVELQQEEGNFDPPFEAYRWRVAYEEVPLLAEVHMVTVTVAWGDEARNEMVEFSSFLRRRGL
jgi:general secretion pathway protein I